MSEPPIHRYDVTFETTEIAEGRSIVAFSLSRNGEAANQDTVFFFEPSEDMTPEATDLLARFLNRYIARFGVAIAETPAAEGE